jgi:hypothetical protein
MSNDAMESAAVDADAAPLDLLLTDAALGALRRVNPGGPGLRLAAAVSSWPPGRRPRPSLVPAPCPWWS